MSTDLNNINKRKITNPDTGQELTIHLKSPEQLEVELELYTNHPKLVALLEQLLKEENYDYETFFGTCFAYCGIILDSTNSSGGYSIKELYEQLARALINKRENMAVSINTIPSKEALLGIAAEMKETHLEQSTKVTTDTKVH